MLQDLIIRYAEISDLEQIVDIYNQAIRSKSATGDTEEFCYEDRIEWFNKFDINSNPIYAVELKNKVVAYCTISPYRPGRKAMSKVAEISYYVDYNFHGKGIVTKLLTYVISDCKRIGKENLLAILLGINIPSIGILKKFNFQKWGEFPDIININGGKCSHLVYGLKL